jgi:signal transduction histidine kinase
VKLGSRGHGRLFLLFLIAVVLPSAALVLFTVRMIRQDRELSEKRRLDDQTRLAAEIGRFLLLRLKNIKLQEAAVAASSSMSREYRNPEVVLVGRVVDDRLLLPWEDDRPAQDPGAPPGFFRSIRLGEQEEFDHGNPAGAAGRFRQALGLAHDANQRAYARLSLARALGKAGKSAQSEKEYRKVLAVESSDEYGIHFSLYACRALLESDEARAEVLKAITALLRDHQWHSPFEAYLIKGLLHSMAQDTSSPDLRSAADGAYRESVEYVRLVEHTLALQRDFEALRLTLSGQSASGRSMPSWTLYGDPPWLVGLADTEATPGDRLVAVRAQDLLESIWSELSAGREAWGDAHLVGSDQAAGVWLGQNFPGVRVVFLDGGPSQSPAPWSAQRTFYWLALALVLSVTLFGSYVLWRDVRRELRMADMRSQFVSSVSHELKTPLTSIRMLAETLSLGRSRKPEAQRLYLETIVNESERLTRLLNNVLDFSKIETGRMAYRPAPASLPDVVRAAARAVQYPLNQEGFTLNVSIENGLPEVRVDRDAIEQAILNLLSNAMKYSGDARTIDLSLLCRDGHAVIRVTDHGIGIDPRDQTRVFEKFYRVDSPENERVTGTGLGLALVAHIVKAHGGRIEVESTPGRGSTFSIYLRLESEP